MRIYPRLLLSCQFEIVEVGGEVSAVSVGGDGNNFNGVIMLKNEPTQFMFKKLQEGISMPELIKACMEEYPGTPVEEAGPEVLKFLDMLKEKHLLLADPKHGIKVVE